MIEMRWHLKASGSWERILQYREGTYDIIDRATGEPEWHGTEWRDVPDVQEHGGRFGAPR